MSEEEKKDFESGQKGEIAPQVDPKQQAKEAKAAKKAVKPQWYVKLIGILAPIASLVLSIVAAVKAAEKGGQTIAIVLFVIAIVLALGSGLACMILPTKKKKRKFIFGFVISMIALSMTLYPLTMIISNSTKGGSGGTSETSQKGGSGSSGTSTSEKGGSSGEEDTSLEPGLIFNFKAVGSTYEVTGLTSAGQMVQNLVVPATHNGKSVTSIGAKAFQATSTSTRTKTVTIPNSVTTFAKNAFYGCLAETVTLPNNLTKITDSMFSYSGIKSLEIPNTVTEIGDTAFSYAPKLTSITFPDSVTKIGERAFYECTALTTVTLGNGMEEIGNMAFSGCSELKTFTIGEHAPYFDSCALYKCDKLDTYSFGALKFLGNSSNNYLVLVDGYNYSSSTLTLPSTTESIMDDAFRRFDESSYTYDGNYTIRTCEFPASVKYLSPNSFANSSIETISFASGSQLKRIGDLAFFNSGLEGTVTLPEGLEKMSQPFGKTGVRYLNIPSTVTNFTVDISLQMYSLREINLASGIEGYSSVNGIICQ